MLTLLALHASGRDETDLVEFCHQLAHQANLRAPRGSFTLADGFTFFRRCSDRSIPAKEVVGLATKWISEKLKVDLVASDQVILVGYSSGAIFAEALLAVAPDRFAGAILMRPEPLSPNFTFVDMPAKPILILAGNRDERRRHDDAAVLAEQLRKAGAIVSLHVLDAGHGWAGNHADITLARAWLASAMTN